MKLFFRKYGVGPPMVILHGLYGMSDNWTHIAKFFANKFQVFIPDQRNHGNSPHTHEHTYEKMVEDLLNFIDEHLLERVILIGHSMGGKTAMKFSVLHGERVSHLIVVDIAPKSYKEDSLKSTGELSHHIILEKMCLVDFERCKSRSEIDDFLGTVIRSSRVRQFLLKNIHRSKNGNYSWTLNLESLRNNIDLIMNGVSYDELLPNSSVSGFPVLFLKGSNSSYIRNDDEEKIRKIFPFAEFQSIEGGGHWVHAEQPEQFIRVVERFLEG